MSEKKSFPTKEYLFLSLENAIAGMVFVMFLVEWLGVYLIANIWIGNRLWWWAGCIWIVGGYVATGITRNISSRLWVQLPMHILFFALLFVYQAFFAGSIVQYGFWGLDILGCIFMQILLSLVTALQNWKGGRNRLPYEIKPYLLIAPIILYFYGRYTKQPAHVICALTMLVLLVILHIVCDYVQGTLRYLQRNRDVSNCPDRYIFYRNSKRVVFFLLLVLSVCIIAGFLQFDIVFVWLAKWIGVGIGYVFQFMEFLYRCFLQLMERLGLGKGIGDSSWLESFFLFWQTRNLEWLYRLLAILIFAGFSFLFFRQAMKFFSSKEETEKEKWSANADLYQDEVEELQPPMARIRDLRPKEAGELVRWRFRQMVKKKYKTHIPRQKTAEELLTLEMAHDMDKERKNPSLASQDVHSFLRLYQKTRYGGEEPGEKS